MKKRYFSSLWVARLADKDADGWYAWGGNAQHNKKQ